MNEIKVVLFTAALHTNLTDMKKLIFGLLLVVSTHGLYRHCRRNDLEQKRKGIDSFTIDMSSILQLASMKDLMNQAGADEEAQKKLGMDKMEKDTTIYFRYMPADLWAKPDRLLEKSPNEHEDERKRQSSSCKCASILTKIQTSSFFKNLTKVMKEGAGELGGMPTRLAPTAVAFKLAKKSLTRLPMPKAENAPSGEDLEMMKNVPARPSTKPFTTCPIA